MTHDLKLGHNCSVVQASDPVVCHVLVSDLARQRQRPERCVEELLVRFSRLLVDVIEELDCVSLGVDEHAVVKDIDDRGTLDDLDPRKRYSVHDRHDRLVLLRGVVVFLGLGFSALL